MLKNLINGISSWKELEKRIAFWWKLPDKESNEWKKWRASLKQK